MLSAAGEPRGISGAGGKRGSKNPGTPSVET